MNIELKPIAESKVRQLGGDVCGVLVRTDGEVMAVSEHGRCTRLDAGVMGPVDGAQGGQSAEPIGFIPYSGLTNLAAGHPAKIYPVDATPSPFESHKMLYTEPQPAVPEGWKLVPVEPTAHQVYAAEFPIDDVVSMRQSSQHAIAKAAYKAMLNAAPTTPQADGWVRCEDRLPEPRRQSRKTPNGILAKHESGRITQFREVTETLVKYMRNGPRKPTKFEQPVGERIAEWMDLDAERAGGEQ